MRALQEAFDRAAAVAGVQELQVQLGSSRASLRFAGDALAARFGPAFAHLCRPPADLPAVDDALTVLLWDSTSTGVQPPRPPWTRQHYQARGEVGHEFPDQIRLSFRIDSGVLSVYDASTRTAICWVRDPGAMPPWEEAAPLRPIFAWWAEFTGRQLAHGAAVGTPAGAVLLAARGGSGKSTTALAALEAGLLYLGDDYVMLEAATPPRVASLYATAKLIPGNMDDRLPALRALVTGRHDVEQDKVTLGLHAAFPGRLVPALPLRAIIVPRLEPAGVLRLERTRPGEALVALAPTTLFQLPNAGEAALRRMASLVGNVPCFSLALGRTHEANVQALRSLLAELPS